MTRYPAKFRATMARRRATWIGALVLATAVCAFAAAASAQYVTPYTFIPPEAAAAGMAAGAANGVDQNQRCYWQSRGRGGPQSHCEDQPPAQPKK